MVLFDDDDEGTGEEVKLEEVSKNNYLYITYRNNSEMADNQLFHYF